MNFLSPELQICNEDLSANSPNSASGKGLQEITRKVQQVISESEITSGLCNIFVRHTSASLGIQENADQDVIQDLEYFLGKLVPENDLGYTHTTEGPDDMPSHIRSALTKTSEQIPFAGAKMLLGTWQGIFLWEHRSRGQSRNVVVHICGD